MTKKTAFIYLAALLSGFLLAACASKPEADLESARTAVAAAMNAGAESYAPEEYQAARQAMDAAESEISDQDNAFFMSRDYEKAQGLLSDAKSKATTATEAAQKNKGEIRQAAQSLKTQLDDAIESATALLGKAPRGKGARAEVAALTMDLDSVKSAASEANRLLADGDPLGAREKFQSLLTRTQSIQSELENAGRRRRR